MEVVCYVNYKCWCVCFIALYIGGFCFGLLFEGFVYFDLLVYIFEFAVLWLAFNLFAGCLFCLCLLMFICYMNYKC